VVVVSRRLDWIAASMVQIAIAVFSNEIAELVYFLVTNRISRLIGSLAIFITLRTFSAAWTA